MRIKPYYQDNFCECGCGRLIASNRRFVSGHNLKGLKHTKEQHKKIGEAQKKAWKEKRKRIPIGSKNKDAHGYIRVKIQVNEGEWPREHTLVLEAFLGRKLKKGETVHHINGIRDDNRIENLFLCKDTSEHLEIERSASSLTKDMVHLGLVRFNKEHKRYERIL